MTGSSLLVSIYHRHIIHAVHYDVVLKYYNARNE